MIKKVLSLSLATVVSVVLASSTSSVGAAPAQKYETGYAKLARLTKDLHRALDSSKSQNLHPMPVLVEKMPAPYLQPSKYFTGTEMVSAVYISSGFVDLMNSFSHAMAIDISNKGYLKSYLAQLSGQEKKAALQPVSASTAWSLDTMNHQHSHFNQIAGTLVAIDMADHYLGYYRKYGKSMGQKQTVPINKFLTAKEWRRAVLSGARNALDCGLGVEGIIYFYESIEGMSARPAWAEYFMPAEADVKKISKDLRKLERYFFAGREFKI